MGDINWTTVIVAALASLPATLAALATLRQGVKTHKAVNSRLTQLLALTEKAALAEGSRAEKERVKK
jgi:hypothetical protein